MWLRRIGWGVAALLLCWGLAWLALPPLLKWQAQQRLSELLGRPVSIERIGIEPWALVLTVENLVIGQPGSTPAGDPLLRFARLRVDAAMVSLLRRAPVVEAIELDGLALRLARTAPGRYDIDDLIERFTPAPDAPASEPLRFALYNLQLREASVRFDDRPVDRVHQVQGLHLSLPFLSNLPAQVEVRVEPRLAFRVGDTHVDTGAQATPFARTRRAELKFSMDALDLGPYLAYQPEGLPLKLLGGDLAADLALDFALPESGEPRVVLKGALQARRVALADRSGLAMLGFSQLAIGLDEVQPLARRAALGKLHVDGLAVHLRRGADGAINWARLDGKGQGSTAAAPARASSRPAAPATAASAAATAASAQPPWQLGLKDLQLNQATVFWRDESVKPVAALQLDGLDFSAGAIAWPATMPVPMRLSASLRRTPAEGQQAGEALAGLEVEGEASPTQAQLSLALSRLSLAAL